MGNQLAPVAAPAQPSEFLEDLPNVVYKKSLGGGRFLKTAWFMRLLNIICFLHFRLTEK